MHTSRIDWYNLQIWNSTYISIIGVPLSEANREQRMNDIVTRKQLVETIKLQDNQISVLRNELERLRMRAFPALVQID